MALKRGCLLHHRSKHPAAGLIIIIITTTTIATTATTTIIIITIINNITFISQARAFSSLCIACGREVKLLALKRRPEGERSHVLIVTGRWGECDLKRG
jgi:hypothetical protein